MTYLPPHFEETDTATLHALVGAYPLATWVVPHQGELLVNHIPFLLDAQRGEHGTLIGHVARANPVWQALPASSVAVFMGPQAYVSPSWYPSKQAHGKAVPTWNYATVHAHGVPQAFDDPARLLALVTRLTQVHEASQAQPWQVQDAPADYLGSMLKAIVGIEIPVQRWVGKWKVSQNRPPADQQGVVAGLKAQGSEAVAQMAALVKPRG
ncbi:MAG: FMN-binding negative transcriptional regulator [Polaromonas sp.]|uniref:FMN-binding negative transcriptional regulator n=1 Tax=Polaromonas sp. TaxID=1869339 RepID=UPI0027314ADA|nr:FMN-binding negative transcriptional regulator [Polaromonas sp.]MDP2255633.1 FMN-binding negative transcriptional regulator [Polaromonas sp.]MDP3709167.1 FMN-binding negative transcriptional regulator [Polaromonas sp.]